MFFHTWSCLNLPEAVTWLDFSHRNSCSFLSHTKHHSSCLVKKATRLVSLPSVGNNARLMNDMRHFISVLLHTWKIIYWLASSLQHDGAVATEDEVMSPTTERLAVYLWLTSTDQRLPAYVAHAFAHDLETKTLKDIQPQLSHSMDSLLAEISTQEDIQVHCARLNYNRCHQFPLKSYKLASSKQSSTKCYQVANTRVIM